MFTSPEFVSSKESWQTTSVNTHVHTLIRAKGGQSCDEIISWTHKQQIWNTVKYISKMNINNSFPELLIKAQAVKQV